MYVQHRIHTWHIGHNTLLKGHDLFPNVSQNNNLVVFIIKIFWGKENKDNTYDPKPCPASTPP